MDAHSILGKLCFLKLDWCKGHDAYLVHLQRYSLVLSAILLTNERDSSLEFAALPSTSSIGGAREGGEGGGCLVDHCWQLGYSYKSVFTSEMILVPGDSL